MNGAVGTGCHTGVAQGGKPLPNIDDPMYAMKKARAAIEG